MKRWKNSFDIIPFIYFPFRCSCGRLFTHARRKGSPISKRQNRQYKSGLHRWGGLWKRNSTYPRGSAIRLQIDSLTFEFSPIDNQEELPIRQSGWSCSRSNALRLRHWRDGSDASDMDRSHGGTIPRMEWKGWFRRQHSSVPRLLRSNHGQIPS